MTQSTWLYIAAALSVITLLVHIFAGGKSVAKPLLESALDNEAKFASYYCWHLVTIVIAFMATCFALSASNITSLELAISASVLAFLFTCWSISLTVLKKQHVMTLPQWILFLPITLAGTLGVY